MWRFESSQAHFKKYIFIGLLAQLAEQGTLNPKVIGSIPIQPTNKASNVASYSRRDTNR